MARSKDTSETTVMRPMIGLQSKETWRRLARKHKASLEMPSLMAFRDGILIYVEVLEKIDVPRGSTFYLILIFNITKVSYPAHYVDNIIRYTGVSHVIAPGYSHRIEASDDLKPACVQVDDVRVTLNSGVKEKDR
ncbi:hypothetical protein M8J77_025619 [Diaphorina citri]|nr:hypothetical protein M8J77_025619 [Diaphorina citri]